jgi:YidC/Oxa1 family membrane protein insertase
LELAIGIGKALRITYTLPEDSYMMHYDIHAYNLENELSTRETGLDMEWGMKIKQQERGRKFENRYSGLYFKYLEDDVENLNNEKSEHQSLTNRVKWIAYKDQFFSSVLISDSYFSSTDVSSELLEGPYLKECYTRTLIPFDPRGDESTHMRFFFGPNQYKILKGFDKGVDSDEHLNLDSLLPLGWAIFGWVNKYMVIPVFDFLGGFLTNYGLIILLLTIIIKIVLLPFTFKSYMSTAKMRVLRPQIDEINAKIPSDKPMERQQATMALYKRAGVSPMGGCLPMLLQMPILYAMFTFFPACIELRQQAFLWADDLSTFDSILSWDTYIPIISSIYGNHVSLFCLLMCVTNVFYTYINMKDQPTNQQMPMMKWMMYLMPIMFLFIFNDYAAGLSYYYLLSLLITIGQTFLFRLFVNDEKLLAKLNENKKKPQKKSKFMDRLEQMQKQQLEMQKQKTQQGNKRR